MKKLFFIAIISLALLITPSVVSAQSMMGSSTNTTSDGHTAIEEAEGKEIWEKLQTKQLACQNLINENYGSLGEYFMGQMAGSSHEAMNNMMKRMMGKEGEEQMHIVMGKQMSGCNTSTQFPQNGAGFMPMMMGMMAPLRQGFAGQGGGGNSMMGYGGWNNMMGGFGIFGWLSMIIFWLLLLLGVIALIRFLTSGGRKDVSKTPFEILKERYAKGEIDKKEFEQKKKDLE